MSSSPRPLRFCETVGEGRSETGQPGIRRRRRWEASACLAEDRAQFAGTKRTEGRLSEMQMVAMLAQERRFRGFQFRGELGRNGCGSLGTGEKERAQAGVPGLGKEKGGPATAKGSSASDPAVWGIHQDMQNQA